MNLAKSIFVILISLIALHTSAQMVRAESIDFNIIASSGGTGTNQGTFTPSSITVDSGDQVSITFSVPVDDIYCCGIQVKGNNGQFDTGTIIKGFSKTITFTATDSFVFTSYWPNTGTIKATGSVTVNVPTPTPPSSPQNLKANAISGTQVDLSWEAGTGAISYEIYRNGSLIGTTPNLYFLDNKLSPGTKYRYKLKSVAGSLKSDFSQEVSATTKKQINVTPTVTTTTNPSTTSSPTPSIKPTSTPKPASDIFTDTKYDYLSINGQIYGFKEIPTIKPGDILKIWGRTVAGANITIAVMSSPRFYSATANENGIWAIEIDTTDYEIGSHTFTTTVSVDKEEYQFEPVALNVSETGEPQIPTSMPTINNETSTTSLSETLKPYASYFMVGGLAASIVAILLLSRVKKS